MNPLERRYFINEKGIGDHFVYALDCFEAILYHALINYPDICPIQAFCDDINACFVQFTNCGRFSITTNSLKLNKNLFNYEMKTIMHNHAISAIEQAINQGVCVAIRTMFDMLPPFGWYQNPEKKGVSNMHWCLIVGYDEKNLFFAESPAMLEPLRLQRHPSNPTVGIIKKSILLEAFKEYCSLLLVRVNVESFSQIDKFDSVLKGSVQNYHVDSVMNTGAIIYKGRSALTEMMQSMKHSLFLNQVTGDYFTFHLLAKRREILKTCLMDKHTNYQNSHIAIDALNDSIKAWAKLYLIFNKHCYIRPYKDLKGRVQKNLADIISLEDRLINVLSKLRLLPA